MATDLRPTRQELEEMMDWVGPEIARCFTEHRITESEAEKLVSEALLGLAVHWNRTRDRGGWLLETLTEEARKLRKPRG